MDANLPIRLALAVLASALPLDAVQAQRLADRTDAWGYTVSVDDSTCAYAPVDVSGASPLLPVAAEGATSATDDGHAFVLLAEPFELYGVATVQFAMSTNGYLAAAAGPHEDDGGDFSNDCPLPAAPRSGTIVMLPHACTTKRTLLCGIGKAARVPSGLPPTNSNIRCCGSTMRQVGSPASSYPSINADRRCPSGALASYAICTAEPAGWSGGYHSPARSGVGGIETCRSLPSFTNTTR